MSDTFNEYLEGPTNPMHLCLDPEANLENPIMGNFETDDHYYQEDSSLHLKLRFDHLFYSVVKYSEITQLRHQV